ncbi:SubName: Full=Uncharacterized protein {ECO:0000313/EMBL:CCA76091.1} [Serendipita indica DSM 11827]|nr:SubName: Full=Uncharacterized protein {ECO:0000313/EMBL:CCA76091.1} [Serendipita indica DSM 11827]
MQHQEQAPVYTPYPTELPPAFPIGFRQTAPLVNVTELQAHLRLLGAISRLKFDVQSQRSGIAARGTKDMAWVVFVNRAVFRFFTWVSASWQRSRPGFDETMIPPLDVLMVWHTYLLNPRTYFEDSQRMESVYATNLCTLAEMPLTLVASLIQGQTLDPLSPSAERQHFFERTTGLPWYMPLTTDYSECLAVFCPLCQVINSRVRWVTDDETGYAQAKFKHRCESCCKEFTKGAMGMRRFVDEVSLQRSGTKVFFSETLLEPPTGKVNEKAAQTFVEKVFKALHKDYKILKPFKGENPAEEATKLGDALAWDFEILCDRLHEGVRPTTVPDRKNRNPRLQRFAVAYSNPGMASIDLVGAVLRQGSFISKMDELGWTRPGRFDLIAESAPLVRSVARYHAFLDLMAAHNSTFFVPTLDIDLAWHTHQLKSVHYRTATTLFVGRFPNHDDNIEPSTLSTAYDITAKAWKARFGVAYSVCGCVPDGDSASRISRFASKIASGFKKRDNSPDPQMRFLLVNKRPDLVSTDEDEADSSHPSEHTANFGNPRDTTTATTRSERERKVAKCLASAHKGAARDPWRGLQAERTSTEGIINAFLARVEAEEWEMGARAARWADVEKDLDLEQDLDVRDVEDVEDVE